MITVYNRAIEHNVITVAQAVGVPVCAVVKANAYGHGLGIVPTLEPYVASYAVATADEAVALRPYTDKTVLVLSGGAYAEVDNVAYCVGSVVDAYGVPSGAQAAVKVNSGMNRLGCGKDLYKILDILAARGIPVHSVYTHFFDPTDGAATAAQFERFDALTADLCLPRHCCAGNALTLDRKYYLDGVRVGLPLYGYGRRDLLPAMTVSAPIVAIHKVKRGEHIGYGTYTAERDMTVATVRLGYADGYRRVDRPVYVDFRGIRCAVVGQICMDAFMFDATRAPVRVGDSVLVLGGEATMESLCDAYQTIEYEVLTGFDRKRTKTIYCDG